MTNLIVPFHQFEIRFTPMLDFGQIAKGLFAPFARLPKKIGIDNEGSFQEIIRLISEDDLYLILISTDRLVLRFEGELNSLLEKNSIVESIIFNILSKAKSHSSFGTIKNCMCYTIFLKPLAKEKGSALNYFQEKYFKNDSMEILNNFTDCSIALQRNTSKIEHNINFGPYKGPSDFANRSINLFPNNPLHPINDSLIDRSVFIDYKLARIQPDVTFSLYKEIISEQIKMSDKEI